MLGKLLKHDLRAVWRGWWPILPVMPIVSTVIAIMFRYLIIESSKTTPFVFGMIMAVVVIIGAYFVLMLTPVYTMLSCFIRFYVNLYTDEGYLTFTLPAKRKDILFSKTLTTVIFMSANTAALFLSVLWIIAVAIPTAEGQFLINFEPWRQLAEFLVKVIIPGFKVWFFVYIIEIVALVALGIFYSTALIQFCFTLGATVVKKAKLLVGILVYVAVTNIISSMGQTVYYFSMFSTMSGITVIVGGMSETAIIVAVAALLLLLNIACALFGCLFYYLTRNVLERKLNLA